MQRRSFLKNLFTATAAAVAVPKVASAAADPAPVTDDSIPRIIPPRNAKAAYVTTVKGGEKTLIKHSLRQPFVTGTAINRKGKPFNVTIEPVDLSSAWVLVEERRWKINKGEPYSVCLYVPCLYVPRV